MRDIIKVENGNAVIDNAAADLIYFYEKRMKELKDAEEKLRAELLEAMEQNAVVQIKTDKMTLSYVAPSDREWFDKKKFREENADLYDKYIKMKPTKASVRITIAKAD